MDAISQFPWREYQILRHKETSCAAHHGEDLGEAQRIETHITNVALELRALHEHRKGLRVLDSIHAHRALGERRPCCRRNAVGEAVGNGKCGQNTQLVDLRTKRLLIDIIRGRRKGGLSDSPSPLRAP